LIPPLWKELLPLRVKTGMLVESIAAADLEKSIGRVLRKLNKVPLVLDSSYNDVANTYLRFQHTTVIEGASFEEEGGMESARKKLVIAMMAGHTLLIALGT